MALQDIFKGITERLQTTANVETVYGEPIVAEGKTIIPVARVRYGFGGGFGEGNGGNGSSRENGGSGGGGGGGIDHQVCLSSRPASRVAGPGIHAGRHLHLPVEGLPQKIHSAIFGADGLVLPGPGAPVY